MISEYPSLNPKILIIRKKSGWPSNPVLFYGGTDLQFLYSGRNAIWHAVKILDLNSNSNILIPSYHCSVEVQAVLEAGAKIKFFAVDTSMRADIEDIKRIIDDNTRAIFIIHYFGFPQPIRELKQICEDRGFYLIEDCAHALFGSFEGKYLGTFGDIGILSLQKFLPLPDGGALIINKKCIEKQLYLARPGTISVVRSLILKILKNIEGNHEKLYRVVGQQLIALIKRLFERFKKTIDLEIANSASAGFQLPSVNLSMSDISKKITTSLDLQRIVEVRRANYELLSRHLQEMPNIEICFPLLPEGVCPCFLPVRLKDRGRVYNQLLIKGIRTFIFGESLHKDVPEFGYDSARYLSKNILALPIHQDLNIVQLEYMARHLRQIVE
jgi:perosamine synthetase